MPSPTSSRNTATCRTMSSASRAAHPAGRPASAACRLAEPAAKNAAHSANSGATWVIRVPGTAPPSAGGPGPRREHRRGRAQGGQVGDRVAVGGIGRAAGPAEPAGGVGQQVPRGLRHRCRPRSARGHAGPGAGSQVVVHRHSLPSTRRHGEHRPPCRTSPSTRPSTQQPPNGRTRPAASIGRRRRDPRAHGASPARFGVRCRGRRSSSSLLPSSNSCSIVHVFGRRVQTGPGIDQAITQGTPRRGPTHHPSTRVRA